MATTQAPTPRTPDSDPTVATPDAAEPDDATQAIDEPGAPADERGRRHLDPVVCVAAALVLVPTIAAMVSALRNPWAPTNDWALLELQVRNVGTGDTPLVGAWSRFGWDHPGPLMFYALAPFYRLVPAEHGLLFAAAAVNFVTVAGAAATTFASTRARALVTLLCLALLQWGLGIADLSDPWNPTLPILPFALYALVCIEVAIGGRRWPLPVAAGLAAFVVQSHVGFAQPVAALLLAALLVRWWTSRRRPAGTEAEPDRPPSWRRALPTVVVVVLTWLPVLIDQVAGSGNVGWITRWALGRDVEGGMGFLTEGRLPAGDVAGAASWLLDPIGLWLGRFEPVETFGFALLDEQAAVRLLWLALAAVGVVALAWRARPADRPPVVAAGAIALAGVLATVGDLATARGAPVFWPFRWAGVVVMLVWLTLGWGVVAAVRSTSRCPSRAVVRVAGVVATALVAVPVALTVWHGSLGEQPVQGASEPLLRLVPTIEGEARRQPVVVANTVDMLEPVDIGLSVILDRAGIPWVERNDPRAVGHDVFYLLPASALDGPIGGFVAEGHVDLLARSGPPRPGEPAGSELVLLLAHPTG